MNIRSVVVITAIAGLIGFVLFAPAPEQDGNSNVGLTVGEPVPNFRLTDLNGKHWDLSELKGSVVIVNFWATWCPSCKEEMPSLNRLYEKYRGRDDFEILAILYNDLPKEARKYVNGEGFEFPILKLNNRVTDDYGVTGVPETYIIDKQGILRKKFKGPVQFDTQESYAFMDRLLAEPGNQQGNKEASTH